MNEEMFAVPFPNGICVEQILLETPMFLWHFEPQGGDHSSAQGNAQCYEANDVIYCSGLTWKLF
jgi:hypothetical protein